jgi:hypothetical protein
VLWTDLRILIVDTGRVWWRLVPLIIGVYLLGWLGSELTLRIAVIAGDLSVRLPPNRGGIDYKESHAREAEEVRR